MNNQNNFICLDPFKDCTDFPGYIQNQSAISYFDQELIKMQIKSVSIFVFAFVYLFFICTKLKICFAQQLANSEIKWVFVICLLLQRIIYGIYNILFIYVYTQMFLFICENVSVSCVYDIFHAQLSALNHSVNITKAEYEYVLLFWVRCVFRSLFWATVPLMRLRDGRTAE